MSHALDGEDPIETAWFPASERRAGPVRSGAFASTAPTALLLHADTGLLGDDDGRLTARSLAAAGCHVLLVRVAARADTGDRAAPRDACVPPSSIRAVIDRLGTRSIAHHAKLGLVGVSAGGTLALQLAAMDDRVGAVVSCFSPSDPSLASLAPHLPPTLLLHGAVDPVVPVAQSLATEAVFRAHDRTVEVMVYADEGHGFVGSAQLDAVARIHGFLRRHLGTGRALGA